MSNKLDNDELTIIIGLLIVLIMLFVTSGSW